MTVRAEIVTLSWFFPELRAQTGAKIPQPSLRIQFKQATAVLPGLSRGMGLDWIALGTECFLNKRQVWVKCSIGTQ